MRLCVKVKTLLLFLIVFGTWHHTYAGKANAIDSLQKALGRHISADTARVNMLEALAHLYHFTNADSEYYYGLQSIDLSRKLNYPLGEVTALEILGSAKFKAGQYDSAITLTRNGLSKSFNHSLHAQSSVLLNNLANIYFRQGKYNEALAYYDSAISYADRSGNLSISAKAQSNIGNIYYMQGNYSHALNYYLAGLQMHEKMGNTDDIASSLANIANVYFRLFQYQQALEYNTRSMELNKKNGDKLNLIGNLTTFALIYDAEQKYDSCLVRLTEALVLAQEMKDAYIENIINTNIAEAYLKMGKYAQALPIYMQSITTAAQLGDVEGLALAKSGAGQVMLAQGDPKKAIPYLTDAFKTVNMMGIKEQALIITQQLAKAYESTGDYKQALYYIKLNVGYRDSINRSKSRQEAQQAVFNYELQKKEGVIDIMRQKENILKSKDRFKSLLIYTFILGMCAAIIVAYLFFENTRKLKRNREALRQQKAEIERQAKKLQELNDFKDNTFNVLSHDLRSPVNALTSAMMLLDEKIITPEEFAMHRHELNSKLQSVSLLLENMLYWARSQMKGETSLSITKLNAKTKALRVIAVLKDAAQQKNITLSCTMPDNVHMYGDMNQVDIILRNLVSNAIKFTPTGGNVVMAVTEDQRHVHISITDNGVGMNEDQVSKLFSSNNHRSTEGTSGERGTGLGLQLCNKFAKNNGGYISVASELGRGTTFTLSLSKHPHN